MDRTLRSLIMLVLLASCSCWTLTRCAPKSAPQELTVMVPRAIADGVSEGVAYTRPAPSSDGAGTAPAVSPPSATMSQPAAATLEPTSSGIRNANGTDYPDVGNYTDGDDENLQSSTKRTDILRERKKQQMLHVIQTTILERLGLSQTPNISSPNLSDNHRRRMVHMFEMMRPQHQVTTQEPDDVYAERVQSFYPLCSVPRNTDKELWSDTGLFHIHYDVPAPRAGTVLTVYTAKLRLYKTGSPMPADDGSAPALCHDTGSTAAGPMADGDWGEGAPREEERFRISVFQYLRPLRKNKRAKKIKKLVDSRMVASDFEGWLEFNVRTSIKDWLETPGKNLGLEIVLEDTLGNNHNPALFFKNMNCSEGRYHQAAVSADGEDEATANGNLYENETYPTLDLRTVEMVPETSEGASGKNEVNRRRRRQARVGPANTCEYTDDCCLTEVTFSWRELDMYPWVIAPRELTTGICYGSCGALDDEIEAECVPIKGDLKILTVGEEDTIIFRTIEDVVTVGCRCRAP